MRNKHKHSTIYMLSPLINVNTQYTQANDSIFEWKREAKFHRVEILLLLLLHISNSIAADSESECCQEEWCRFPFVNVNWRIFGNFEAADIKYTTQTVLKNEETYNGRIISLFIVFLQNDEFASDSMEWKSVFRLSIVTAIW